MRFGELCENIAYLAAIAISNCDLVLPPGAGVRFGKLRG